jgi:arylsulfatase A-like enzyme
VADNNITSHPNIVFIFSDDHACQAISSYGSKVNQTPNIDRIAIEGAIFRNNFCANSICGPSRATILTGKHSHMNGFFNNNDSFDGEQVTFPKLLQKAGYTTAIFGKWHLKSEPTGFDEWMVYPKQGSYYNPDYITPQGKKQLTGYSVKLTTALALDFLKRQNDPDKPFLLMCQYKAPHRNWNPGPKYLTKYDEMTIPEPETLFDDYQGRASPASNHAMGIDKHLRMHRDLKVPHTECKDWSRMTEDQRKAFAEAYESRNIVFENAELQGTDLIRWKYQRYIKDYLRCIAAVDDNVGRILDYLEKNKLDKNTIVIYSSDQGFYLGEHGWFDKRWMYEESFRMPLIIRWPGKIKPGTIFTQLTQNIDFAPTILEAAGAKVHEDIQGISLMPLIKGEKTDWRKSLYYHYYEHGVHGVARHYGVRTERYKLIHFYTTDEWELFDLINDPQEMTSVYYNSAYKKVRKDLEAELNRLRNFYKVPNNNK